MVEFIALLDFDIIFVFSPVYAFSTKKSWGGEHLRLCMDLSFLIIEILIIFR